MFYIHVNISWQLFVVSRMFLVFPLQIKAFACCATSNPHIQCKQQNCDPDAICFRLSASMHGSVSPSVVSYTGIYANAAILPPSLLRCPLLSATASSDWLDPGFKAHPKDIHCTICILILKWYLSFVVHALWAKNVIWFRLCSCWMWLLNEDSIQQDSRQHECVRINLMWHWQPKEIQIQSKLWVQQHSWDKLT